MACQLPGLASNLWSCMQKEGFHGREGGYPDFRVSLSEVKAKRQHIVNICSAVILANCKRDDTKIGFES